MRHAAPLMCLTAAATILCLPSVISAQADTIFRLPAGSSLSVFVPLGTITVSGTSGPNVGLRVTRLALNQVDVVQTGAVLLIQPRDARGGRRPSFTIDSNGVITANAMVQRNSRSPQPVPVHFEVSVPTGISLDIATVDGNVTLRDVEGTAHITVIRGVVRVDGWDGSLGVDNLEGKVDLRRTRGTISVVAPNDSILVQQVVGRLSARSINGAIEVRDAELAMADLRTYNDGIRFEGRITGAGPFLLSAFNGDVSATLANPRSLQVDFATVSGSVQLPAAMRPRFGVAGKRGSATIGTAPPVLRMESFGGDIVVVFAP